MFVYDGCLFVLILDCDSQVNQKIMVGMLKRDIQTSQGSWIMVLSLSLACLCKFQIV
jgi:hypothetical protein